MCDFLDAIAPAPTPVSERVSQLVIGQWVIVSDFGDSYPIYRACELVSYMLDQYWVQKGDIIQFVGFIFPWKDQKSGFLRVGEAACRLI